VDTAVQFLCFDHVSLVVADLGAATASWEEHLGWTPREGPLDRAVFDLDDSYIELLPPSNRLPVGAIAATVAVPDPAAAAEHLRSVQCAYSRDAEGGLSPDPGAINGLNLRLIGRREVQSVPGSGPFRRINHMVVAVRDNDATLATWSRIFGEWRSPSLTSAEAAHHVPVGAAWFGLTAAGTNADALASFLARRGEGAYALGLAVDDLDQTAGQLAGRGARLIHSEASHQTFVHPATTHGLLLDMVQQRPEPHVAA
jgi:hypothetical protein